MASTTSETPEDHSLFLLQHGNAYYAEEVKKKGGFLAPAASAAAPTNRRGERHEEHGDRNRPALTKIPEPIRVSDHVPYVIDAEDGGCYDSRVNRVREVVKRPCGHAFLVKGFDFSKKEEAWHNIAEYRLLRQGGRLKAGVEPLTRNVSDLFGVHGLKYYNTGFLVSVFLLRQEERYRSCYSREDVG